VNLLLWIVRLLVLLLIIRFVVGMVRQAMQSARAKGAPQQRGRSGRHPERLGGTLVQDPQCGTYLPKDWALTAGAGSATQYFCSDKCRDEWAGRS
jgi:uncharacterized protein